MWKCSSCKKKTPDDRQFCQHCGFNVGWYYSKYKDRIIATETLLGRQKRQWQREKHSTDLIQPWKLKEGSHKAGKKEKWIANKDFIKAYPDRTKDYFTESDVKEAE